MLNLIADNLNLNLNKSNFVKTSKVNFYGMNFSRLQPLQKDTVSFSGAAKFEGAGMAYAPTEKIAKQAHINAEPAQFLLQTVFDTYLAPDLDSKKSSKTQGPVEYKTRIKSPNSIREKVAAKVMKFYSEDIETLSKQISESFSEHFGLNEGVKKQDAEAHIKNTVLMHSEPNAAYSPYTAVSSFVDSAFDVSREYNLFSTDKYNEKQLSKIFFDIVENIDNSEPAKAAEERLKHPSHTIDGIKHYAYDIVGGKIIFNENDDEYAKKIVDGLKAAVDDNVLKIKSIENNIPDESRLSPSERSYQYAYIPEARLRDLAEVSGAKLINKHSKAGYMSVHINVDLTSDLLKGYKGKYNGYCGEIQITGRDVNELKKTEDLCYKFKDNKNVYHKAYQPFKEHFLKYYKGPVKKYFEDYTYALYLNQRKANDVNREYKFPTIEELGFECFVPKELDFNYLSQLKEECDRNKAIMDADNSQEKVKSQNQIRNDFKSEAEIDGLKKFIAFSIKKNVTNS